MSLHAKDGLIHSLLILVIIFSITSHGLVAVPPSTSPKEIIPVTTLSGFLGAGKTTLLQHLLTNSEGLKIAVIVNDVAEVNIDNKLIAGQTAFNDVMSTGRPAGIIELSNGCACCSLSDELLSSLSQLITLSDLRRYSDDDDDDDESSDGKGGFDHIVVELSGISSPKAIRAHFQDAMYYNMPLLERVRLDTMVTVVDSNSFLKLLEDKAGKLLNEKDSPEFYFRNEAEKIANEYMKDDDDTDDYWESLMQYEDHAESTVSQLLVEQTETADVVLLNKVDILEDESNSPKLDDIQSVVSALNPRANVIHSKFGQVGKIEHILGVAMGKGVVDSGVIDDHRDYVKSAVSSTSISEQKNTDTVGKEVSHSHDHDSHGLSTETDTSTCSDPNCTDPSHEHSHMHSHGDSHEDSNGSTTTVEKSTSSCTDPDCTDTSHSHDHHSHSSVTANDSSVSSIRSDPDFSDTSREHSHSHSHHHSHSHKATDDSEQSYGGIGSFAYRARRPFHPKRLHAFLRHLPIVRGLETSENEEMDMEKTEEDTSLIMDEKVKRIVSKIVRSKGFCWLASSHIAANYWSHTMSTFQCECLGRWWATLPQEQWPEESIDNILSDFDDHDHVESLEHLTSVGDRRQEIVIIGPGMANTQRQQSICKALDECLLLDDEFALYKEHIDNETFLKSTFANPISVTMASY